MSNNSSLISYQTNHSNQIHLNSASGSSNNGTMKSDLLFKFNNILSSHNRIIELRISLVKAQIPNSFYLINSSNNQIIINGTTYTFPVGNYSVSQFISQWNTTVGGIWSLTLSTITNKITFYNTGNSFTFSDNSKSIFKLLGFVNGNTYASVSGYLTSTNCIDFSGIRNIVVRANNISLRNCICIDTGCGNCLGSVPNNFQFGSIIQYVNFTNFKNIFSSSELNSFAIQLCDDNLNLLDFNNIDWTMTIQVDVICEEIKDLANFQEVLEKGNSKIKSEEVI
jgi:hypothetical protein